MSELPQADPATVISRRSLLAAGASLGAGVVLSSCSSEDTTGQATGPPVDAAKAGMPYRQDDPRWGSDLMWDRNLVIKAATELDGRPSAEAEALIREYPDGNNIANEGCQLTCIAMVLRLFDPQASPTWTPATLNRAAQDAFYYTRSGLSLTTLYSDLASEMTDGGTQLLAKEEYLPGVAPWPRVTTASSTLVRAYRSLTPGQRSGTLLMIKTGTYDDTIASHYVLLDPSETDSPDIADARILDPAMPADAQLPWRLSDSAKAIKADPEIAAAWKQDGITPTQIGGAWVFARWDRSTARPLAAQFVSEWAKQINQQSSTR